MTADLTVTIANNWTLDAPRVPRNATTGNVASAGVVWAPCQVAIHPGEFGENAVMRFTAPTSGAYQLQTSIVSKPASLELIL